MIENADWTCSLCKYVTPDEHRSHEYHTSQIEDGPVPKYRQMTIDHIIRRVDGGSDSKSNLRVACYQCNQEREDGPRAQRRAQRRAENWARKVEILTRLGMPIPTPRGTPTSD